MTPFMFWSGDSSTVFWCLVGVLLTFLLGLAAARILKLQQTARTLQRNADDIKLYRTMTGQDKLPGTSEENKPRLRVLKGGK
jgi:hypothetical protein